MNPPHLKQVIRSLYYNCMDTIATSVKNEFSRRFSSIPYLYYSPGRINLIGEHIDYNDGFVMPAAIDKGVYYAVAPNNTDKLNFYSIDFEESLSVSLTGIMKIDTWKNYVLSVVNEFLLLKMPVKGFDCVFGGNISGGAGLSSSAAVEGGLAFAINDIFNCGFSSKDLALLCQRAEHNFPGVNCGIMDQFANMMGKQNHVILLDCRTMEHKYYPLQLDGYEIVLINTKVHHSLAASEYNKRRQECEEGLIIIGFDSPVKSFRDINKPEDLLAYRDKMGTEIYNRCLFVVEEIARTQRAASLLQSNDLAGFGKLMYEAHDGLSKLYNVSCKELDFLVELARKNENVLGSRMMGGGFGGCTINIVKSEREEEFVHDATRAYKKQFGIDAEVYKVKIVDGTHRIDS